MPYSVRAILGSSDEVMKKGCICWLAEIPDFAGAFKDLKVVGKSKGGRNTSRTIALTDFSSFSASPIEKYSDERIVLATRTAARELAEQLTAAQPGPLAPDLLVNHDAEWIRRSAKPAALL